MELKIELNQLRDEVRNLTPEDAKHTVASFVSDLVEASIRHNAMVEENHPNVPAIHIGELELAYCIATTLYREDAGLRKTAEEWGDAKGEHYLNMVRSFCGAAMAMGVHNMVERSHDDNQHHGRN